MKTPVLKDELKILVKISLPVSDPLSRWKKWNPKQTPFNHTLMRWESQVPFLHTQAQSLPDGYRMWMEKPVLIYPIE